MIFYIVSGPKPEVECNTSDIEFSFDNLDVAVRWFKINRKRFRYAYLLADFQVQNNKGIAKMSPDDKVLPFLLLAEYSKEHGFVFRKDIIILKSPGIEEEFSKNVSALRRFFELYESKIPCTMSMRYAYENKEDKKIMVNEPFIISTAALSNSQIHVKEKISFVPLSSLNPLPKVFERKFKNAI